MNEEGIGYPIYRMNEIHTMMCDLDVDKNAVLSVTEKNLFVLRDRDVLFNRTNSFEWVGRTGIYRKIDPRDFVFASYLVRFVPKESVLLPEYLTTFLNTKFGVWDLKRRARQSINQTNINPEEVKEVDIPLLHLDFQNLIKQCFDIAHQNRITAKQTYTQAEQILLQELGLSDTEIKRVEPPYQEVNYSVKSFKNSFIQTGRLDAEYYQLKYEEIEKQFDNYRRIKLSELVNYPISSGITPKAGGDDYTDESRGIPFVRAVDLQDGQVSVINFNYIKPEIHNGILKRTQLKNGDVLFSIAGTVGRCAVFKHDFEANINQAVAILRFDEDVINRFYLMVLFNSPVGKSFVEKYSRQGLQTNLNLTEVGDLSIPIIEYSKQQQIAKWVEESFALKQQARQLLEAAKRAVEIAIEQNEEAAMAYLQPYLAV